MNRCCTRRYDGDRGFPERSALAIAGDDDAAKQTVTEFLDASRYDAHDVGPLSEGGRYQRDTAVSVQPTPHRAPTTPCGRDARSHRRGWTSWT